MNEKIVVINKKVEIIVFFLLLNPNEIILLSLYKRNVIHPNPISQNLVIGKNMQRIVPIEKIKK